jgi:toxin-antitoxin system PIN domain toxin
MSYSVDVNLLLYATDDRSIYHAKAARFVASFAERRELLVLGWPTVMSYLRLVTHPSILRTPLPPDQAAAHIDALMGLPNTRVVAEDDGFWDAYCDAARGHKVRGNLVPDTHLAALLRQHGVGTFYSKDTDFRKFKFLRVVDPFA